MKKIIFYLFIIISIQSCKNASNYRKNAEKFYENGNYEQSLILINKAIELEPYSVNNYIIRRKIYNITNHFKNEISDIDKIIELNSNVGIKSVIEYYQKTIAEYRIGLYKEALIDINYFINNRDTIGDLDEIYIDKAFIFYYLDKLDSSYIYFCLAENENNNNSIKTKVDVLIGKADIQKHRGNFNEALNLLNKAIKLDTTDFSSYSARASLYFELEKYELVYTDLKKAIILDPNYASLFNNLALLQISYTHEYQESINNYLKAIKLSPDHPDNHVSYFNLAVANYKLGNFNEAIKAMKMSATLDSSSPETFYYLSMYLYELDRYREALIKINRAIEINPSDADFYYYKGRILMQLKSYEVAISAFKDEIKINPSSGRAYFNIGKLFGILKNHSQSIKYYDKAFSLKFNLEQTLVNRAYQKILSNRISSACTDLRKAIQLGRNDVIPLLNKHCN